MRITLAEGDVIRRSEFKLNNQRIEEHIKVVEACVIDNKESTDKLSLIMIGNGEGGIIWKVNMLMLRNQWLDKGVNVFIGIGASLLTLWLTGVLHL